MSATIVVAVDRSPAAEQAVRLIAGYMGPRDALSVVLLNAQPLPFGDWPGYTADLRSLEEALQREGRAELAEAQLRLADAKLAVEPSVRHGVISERVIEAGSEHHAAAIVMGTRGHGVLRGFALGSVALRVAHRAPSPVLLVQADARLPANLGRSMRILVALDGSPHATRAVKELLGRQSWLGELDIELAYVRPARLLDRYPPPEQQILERWGTQEAEEATRDARALVYAAGRPCRLHEPAGDPAEELVRLAAEAGADLVVAGTRGRGALHHALIGSVALKVAIGSPVPVMLVP